MAQGMKKELVALFADKSFYRRWLFACSISIPVSLALGKSISFTIGFAMGNSKAWAFGFAISSVITGALIGLAQWLVLGKGIAQGYRWVVASSLGWTIGNLMTAMVGNKVFGMVNLAIFGTVNIGLVWAISGVISGFVSGAMGGIVMGLAQWLVLKEKIAKANGWVLSSSLSWAVGNLAIATIDVTATGTIGLVLSWVIYGVAYGLVTREILLWRSLQFVDK